MIQTESLETRVLLTATDGTDINLSAYSPDNPYSSMMNDSSGTYSQVSSEYLDPSAYSTAIADSPINDSMGSAGDMLQTYITAGQTASNQSYEQSMSSQYDASMTLQNSNGTTTGTGTTTNTGTTGTNTTTGTGSGTAGTGTGTTAGGDENGDGDSENGSEEDNATESLFPEWKPFQIPQGVAFAVTTLPAQEFQQDLFAVQPAGTDTFANTVTTTSTVGSTAGAGSEVSETSNETEVLPLTDLTTIVTTEQTYHSANDWTVRQSVTNRFDQNAHSNNDTEDSDSDSDNNDATGDSNADDTNNGRTGSKTFSITVITVINGTTTITSFHMSDTFTFSSGSIPGESETDDPYAIPADWIQQAIKSVNKPAGSDIAIASSTSDDAEEDDEDDTGTSTLPNGSGVFVTASYDVSADVTKSLITLDDGSMAITYTLAIGFSASFSTRAGGHYSISESDLDADALSELDGLAIDASSDFAFFAAGSVAASFTATATLPLSVNLDDADFAASFQFGTSFNTGGTSSSMVKATKNVSSGSASDNNDVYDRVNIKHKTSSSGYFGASFWLGASTESDETDDDDDSGEVGAETEGETNSGGDESGGDTSGDSSDPSDETSSLAGSKPATDLIESDKTGLQLSLAVNGSTTTTDKAKVESKSRWTTSDAYGYQSSLDHEKSESTSEVHFVAELGTENMLLDFGISGGDSAEIEQEFKAWTQPTSDPVRTLPSLTLNRYSETFESHSSAGLVLGGDDPGLTSSGGYSVDIEGTHEIHGEWIWCDDHHWLPRNLPRPRRRC